MTARANVDAGRIRVGQDEPLPSLARCHDLLQYHLWIDRTALGSSTKITLSNGMPYRLANVVDVTQDHAFKKLT
jgi:hypothetical protein